MASKILIKRSGTTGSPSTLRSGEMAYSYATGHQKLFIGWGAETTPGEADNIGVIGGVYFTSMLDHAAGTLTAGSALIVDANKKIDNLKVDNLDLNLNTISTTNTNGNLVLAPNGTAHVDVSSSKIINVTDPSGDQHAATKKYVDDQVGAVVSDFTISDGTDSDLFSTGETLTFAGGTGITSTVTNNQVSLAITNTAVTAGSYGSATAIPVITVNEQGQITNTSTSAITTTMAVAVDNAGPDGDSAGTIALATDTLTFVGDSSQGIDISFNDASKKFTITGEDATVTNKGVASFATSDFAVSSGAVSIKTGGVSNTQLAGSIANNKLANSSLTVTAGDGLGGGGSVALGSSVSLNVNVDNSTIETSSDTLRIKDGGVTNAKLDNDSLTVGSTSIALGASSTVLAGLTQIDVDNIRIDGNTISTTNGGATELYLDPNPVGDSGTVVVRGNLTVQGLTTTIHSTEVTINDLTLILGDSADNAAEADGAGLIVGSSTFTGGDRPTFLYEASGDKWVANKTIDATILGMSETIDDRVSSLLLAGEGIDLTYADASNSLTVTAETATATNLGVAKFPTANFTLTSGSVAISTIDGGTYS